MNLTASLKPSNCMVSIFNISKGKQNRFSPTELLPSNITDSPDNLPDDPRFFTTTKTKIQRQIKTVGQSLKRSFSTHILHVCLAIGLPSAQYADTDLLPVTSPEEAAVMRYVRRLSFLCLHSN